MKTVFAIILLASMNAMALVSPQQPPQIHPSQINENDPGLSHFTPTTCPHLLAKQLRERNIANAGKTTSQSSSKPGTY